MQAGKDNRNILHWVFKTIEFTEKNKTKLHIYIVWHSMFAQ